MTVMQQTSVGEEQWKQAADAFELGYKNAVEIAAELGVSRSTVSRQFKRRGCQKGCRAMETVAKLEAELDAKARQRAAMRRAREEAVARRSAELDALLEEMMRSVALAWKKGDLSDATSTINKVGKSLGAKLSR
jgi:IS30 family transposase